MVIRVDIREPRVCVCHTQPGSNDIINAQEHDAKRYKAAPVLSQRKATQHSATTRTDTAGGNESSEDPVCALGNRHVRGCPPMLVLCVWVRSALYEHFNRHTAPRKHCVVERGLQRGRSAAVPCVSCEALSIKRNGDCLAASHSYV